MTTTGVYQSTFIRSYNLIGDHMKQIGLRQTTISNLVFYSRYWNMYSTGIDAFTVDWHGVNGLLCTSYIFITTSIEIYETVEQLEF